MSKRSRYLFSNFIDSINAWNSINLEKLTLKIGDGIHSTPKFIKNSHYYFINGNNLQKGKILIDRKTYRISEIEYDMLSQNLGQYTILYSINGTIGNIAIYNDEAVVLGKSVAFITCPNRTIQYFLYYLLQSESAKNYFDIELTGSTIRNLSLRSIRNTPVIFPNESEQRKIASILTTIDNIIEKTQAAIEKYKSIKQGMMHDLFTRGIDPKTNNLRPKYEEAPVLYKVSNYGMIPAEWDIVELDNGTDIITDFAANGSFATLKLNVKYYYEPNYARLIRLTDLRTGMQNNGVYVDKIGYNFIESAHLKENDLLIANVGEYTGFTCLMPKVDYLSAIAPNMFIIRTNTSLFYLFLFYFMNLELIQKAISNISTSSATPLLNKTNLRSLKVCKPSFKEQIKIGSTLSSIDLKIKKELEILKKYIKIKQGLMQDLLTGKKRVKIND